MKKNNGVFTENFIGIETDDGVAGVFAIQQRKADDIIDFNDNTNMIKIRDVEEGRELIALIEKGIKYLGNN